MRKEATVVKRTYNDGSERYLIRVTVYHENELTESYFKKRRFGTPDTYSDYYSAKAVADRVGFTETEVTE